MALRYVARRVGVPSLRGASGPHPSPSAGSGPLASRSSQCCTVSLGLSYGLLNRLPSMPHGNQTLGSFEVPLAAYSNGFADQKMKKRLGESLSEKNAAELEMDGVAKVKASFQAASEAVEHARRMEKLKWRFFLGSGAAGVGLGLCAVSYLARQAAVVVSR